jgi:squalene-hopene/tetraprenyl-beta-curcumene cyclase
MRLLGTAILITCAGVAAAGQNGSTSGAPNTGWSEKAAGAYLDGRMTWWTTWLTAARDHQTFCVSCHTVLPYAMARPALRAGLSEYGAAPLEEKLLENVTKRVRMWNEVEPFYPDAKRGVPKTAESRGTESILNAVILVSYDKSTGKFSADARLALDHMWAEQLRTGEEKGAWNWLQFHNSPWEGDSQYYGATLAALAVGEAPREYRDRAEIQEPMNELREYLPREEKSQILINRVMLLWASTKMPGLLTPIQQKRIIEEALSKQQADGGFTLSSFAGGWKRRDDTPLETKSDGLATGLVTLVLQLAGIAPDQPQLRRGLTWLAQNQDPTEGRWLAYSLNKQRDLSSDVGRFMSDAATAYAVLALEQAK